ncbi:methionyl-tRNA formyltransferase [Fictibacillus enclensis]|uniref:Methionyl-tRNA formyltransferase n=1 Tax=Fictibacillus enclensis TaxID=1017270 RepID=A0A0V8JDB7_9BACL|nr:methionyl-tRNA formyltransferase [Fictibacillus enclensis]KSU85022.1 methionyl-tRNA formyltransferase [Fictibacillus enclensis]SCB89668.1 methionyl-tRNA formyltransferase [Fictibacillus enclensis]
MKIVFMGTPDFSVGVLRRLVEDGYEVAAVVTQPDKPQGRKKEIKPTPVKEEAMKHGIPVLQPKKLRAEYEEVLEYKPDLIVTAAYGQILPSEILQAPQYGCVNVHASLLPEYRGGAPIHQSIIDGKTETGVTIMYMVDKLDAGDILTQVKVPIEEEDHVDSMFRKLSIAGAELLSKTLPDLIEGRLTPIKQDESKVTYAYNISREQEEIDWSKSGEAIYNQIRGMHPWPVAFTKLNGQPLKVWWGKKVRTGAEAEPGTVLETNKEGFVVNTGDSTGILITDLQPAGKKRMAATQFLQGAKLKPGIRLGEDA